MSVPDYQSIMLPLLKRIAASPKPVSIIELVPVLAKDMHLTEQDLAERLPSGRFGKFYNRMHWAKLYTTRAGLLESPQRGKFQITQRGRELLAENPRAIDNQTLSRYAEFNAWRSHGPVDRTKDEVDATITTQSVSEPPDERIYSAQKDLEAALTSELLDNVRKMDAADFEGLIIQLLVAMDYGQGRAEMAAALGGKGDGGMDGVINQDPLGLDRVYIQAKRWKDGNTVGPKEIRDFIGALNIHRANKGVFVTASSFSGDAEKAAHGSTVHVVLIDGEQLAELMIHYEVGVVVRDTIKIKAIDEGYF
ncbi:MAG TPA: restriction endonuclease [Rhizomicrobium sp.]|nr:restriction endonuclease [Rhizomicrobium sp.]